MLMILIFPMEIHELRKDGELVGISTTCALCSSQLSDTAARRLSVESLSLSPTLLDRRPSAPLTPRAPTPPNTPASLNALLAPSVGPGGPGLTPTNTPANMNELLAPPPMPRRASTYHDTEKANSGELDNSGGSAAVPNTSREATLRFPRRRLLDGVTRATQVDGQEPAAPAQADAPARALPGQRLRCGRGVGTRAFLRSFVVAVLTPPPSLPPCLL